MNCIVGYIPYIVLGGILGFLFTLVQDELDK